MIMVKSMGSLVSFIASRENYESLTAPEKEKLNNVLKSCFRLPSPEYTIMGLKSLMGINRRVIKEAFMDLDDPVVTKFILSNREVLDM